MKSAILITIFSQTTFKLEPSHDCCLLMSEQHFYLPWIKGELSNTTYME